MGEVNLDGSIYEGMRRAEASEEFGPLPLETRAVLHHMRVSMEHEGIHLPDAEKAQCLQLLEREQELSFGIVQHQERARRTFAGADGSVEGLWLPLEGVTDALGQQVGNLPRRRGANKEEVLVVPDSPWAEQVLKCSGCSESRRRVHEAQQAPDEQGEAEMAELLSVRQQLARLRGYRNWGEYAQREALLANPDRVDRFLGSAWERLRPGFLADLQLLAAEKDRLGLGKPVLEAWDIPLLLHRCRLQQEQQGSSISEYLTYGAMMRGVELILSELLGLAFVAEEPKEGEVWHPSVQKYTLREHKDGRALGILYLDPFARPGKVVQSAQFTLQGSKQLDGGETQIPVTTLVYSLPVEMVGLPLSYAITFMHEIGHAVHSLLSETTFQHLSGTRGTVDFVEFPSHLFEHFVLDPDCLVKYAAHAKTGAPLPAELGRSCLRSRQQFAHIEAVQQLMYAVVDQAFYTCVPSATSVGGGSAEVRQHLAGVVGRFDQGVDGPFSGQFTSLLGLSRISKFDHLVHYGGSYYCYLFNRALSAHVWQHGFRDDPFAADAGSRLRGLLRGGSVVQDLSAIEALCPGAGGFRAEDVPLDAFVAQLSSAG